MSKKSSLWGLSIRRRWRQNQITHRIMTTVRVVRPNFQRANAYANIPRKRLKR